MKLRRFLSLNVPVCALVFLLCSVTFAQQPTGSVGGNAYDQSGASVAGAQVTLRNVATGEAKTLTTSPEGLFEFLALRPATYEVVAEAKGFRRLHLAEIVVNVGSVVRTDLHFEVGEITQVVEVTTETPLIEPDRTSVNRSVDLKEVSNLPMLGRDILSLALTAPGTIQGAPGTQVVAFSVAGMRTQSNNYTLDGVSNNDPQVNGPLNLFHLTDAIQEFNVQTSIASTDVGRSSGAQVSIITKSGTNAVHGTLFYTGRNDLLDANDFFLNRAGKKKMRCAGISSAARLGVRSSATRPSGISATRPSGTKLSNLLLPECRLPRSGPLSPIRFLKRCWHSSRMRTRRQLAAPTGREPPLPLTTTTPTSGA
jgi:hypothetical protein